MPAPDSKVHGAHMGPIWGRQDPGGPHVGPLNFAIWGHKLSKQDYIERESARNDVLKFWSRVLIYIYIYDH